MQECRRQRWPLGRAGSERHASDWASGTTITALRHEEREVLWSGQRTRPNLRGSSAARSASGSGRCWAAPATCRRSGIRGSRVGLFWTDGLCGCPLELGAGVLLGITISLECVKELHEAGLEMPPRHRQERYSTSGTQPIERDPSSGGDGPYMRRLSSCIVHGIDEERDNER